MNQEVGYDALVVGTGISGGWATKELCEKGLKTLVLERGRMVKHLEDYPTMNDDPWNYPLKGALSAEDKKKYHVQARVNWAPKEDVKHFFVNDLEHPYVETKRFDWIRGYQVGGRSLTWGRQSYRWSDIDFSANKKEGVSIDWPVRYKDVQPYEESSGPGLGIHEMGGARMGHDPKTSVLNKNNQIHAVPNVFVTDGAFMTSSNCANPSLTYMAFTARAANHTVEQIKAGKFS